MCQSENIQWGHLIGEQLKFVPLGGDVGSMVKAVPVYFGIVSIDQTRISGITAAHCECGYLMLFGH